MIPRSHHNGALPNRIQGQGWEADLSADLKYTTAHDVVTNLVQKNGIVAPTGPAGSVLFFHPNCVHGSGSNISPFSRNVAIITYNSVKNLPRKTEDLRPDFLVNRDASPLEPLADNFLVSLHQ